MSPPKEDDGQHAQEVVPETVLRGKKLAVVFAAMLLAVLLVSLDQTILATALPRIASDFNAFEQQGWIAGAFVLTNTAFMLPFGQMLRTYPAKWLLLVAIGIFEVGSLVCATAMSATALIAGRAVSGVGAAGLLVSMIQILAQTTLLKDRARLFGLFGGVFGVASIVGPLIGGALTDHASWRWCFYINLPVGGVTSAAVLFLIKASPPLGSDPTKRSTTELLRQTANFDYVGAVLSLAAVTCLSLALNYGGNTKPWNSPAVIASLVVCCVLTVACVGWQVWKGEAAMVPPAIFRSWSVCATLGYSFLSRFALLVYSYYIPTYFQAAKGKTAVESAISMLPLMLSSVIGVIVAGQVTGKTGRFWYWLVIGPPFLAIGAGLFYTVTPLTSTAALIGFQILVGAGQGVEMQQTGLAIQAEFADTPRLIGQGASTGTFLQLLGGTISLAVSQSVFAGRLSKELVIHAPSAPLALIKESPVYIRSQVDPALVPIVVSAYTRALNAVFIIPVPVAVLSLVLAMFIKNIDISKKGPSPAPSPTAEEKV